MKPSEYSVNIYDDSLRRRLERRKSEARLAVSIIQARDQLLPAFWYADYEKLFPLPSHKLRDPEEAGIEALRMLDAVSGMLYGGGIPVPREDMMDIGDWIAPEATEMAAAAHVYGVGASIAVHIKLFTRELSSGVVEEEDEDADNPLRQEFQESEVDDDDDEDDDDDDDDVLVDSPNREWSPGNVQ